MKKKMFGGASNLHFDMARKMRKSPTHSEDLLWNFLKTKPLGFKFRRQHPYSVYIFDFYCHALRLIIEVDGSIHNDTGVKHNDEQRQKLLEEDGFRVIRYTNEKITNSPEKVIDELNKYLANQK